MMTSRALATAVGVANVVLMVASCRGPAAVDQPEVGVSAEWAEAPECSTLPLGKLPRPSHSPVKVLYLAEPSASLVFEAGLHVDADGAPDAYRSDDKGLDYLANACSRTGRC